MEIIEVFLKDSILESTILFYDEGFIKKIVSKEKEDFFFLDNLYNREMSLEDKYTSVVKLAETNKRTSEIVDFSDEILIKNKNNVRIKMYLREIILNQIV